MLTGEYAFRQEARRTSILDGDAPLAITPGRPTLPQVLRDAGYTTALVGKWHLGIGDGNNPVDFNTYVGPGPLEVGFDSAFYIPATVDRVPCVFIDNHAVYNLNPKDPIQISYQHPFDDEPVAREHPELLKYPGDQQHSDALINGIGRIGYMSGGKAARWVDEEITDVLAARARQVIENRGEAPLFLLLGAHDPHKPHLPHARFEGESRAGRRGDSIVQFDWLVGQVVDAIRSEGITEQTLLFITSDNGPAIYDGYDDGSLESLGDHRAAGPYRGLKYTTYEGGCRVPGIVSWPKVVKPGVSDQMFSLLDLLATLPQIVGILRPGEGGGTDAIDLSHVLLGLEGGTRRESLVLQGMGRRYAIVSDRWKFIPATNPNATQPATPATGRDTRFSDLSIYRDALYDLKNDPGEQKNEFDLYPEIAAALKKDMQILLSDSPKDR
jgi:arylsulfatase A-like enzyme